MVENVFGSCDRACPDIAHLLLRYTGSKSPEQAAVVFVESIKQSCVFIYPERVWQAIGPIKIAGVPVNGTSGTGVGVLYVGCMCINTLTGICYQNFGSASSPYWKKMRSDYSSS
jgi:hypothetical protein